jgi:hypothetical protein
MRVVMGLFSGRAACSSGVGSIGEAWCCACSGFNNGDG